MNDKVRLASGTCPAHGRVLFAPHGDRPRCPKCYRWANGRDTRPVLADVAPYGAAEWDAARSVAELRACDAAFDRAWSPRRHRLAFCALARLYFAKSREYWLWKAVEAGEAWADAAEPPPDAADIFARLGGDPFGYHAIAAPEPGTWKWLALACVFAQVTDENMWDGRPLVVPPPPFDFRPTAEGWLAPAPAAVYRELSPNPFAPVAWKPEWRSPTAVEMARHVYEAREFELMPIVADALQDAGCDDAHVLGHCREGRSHARGCWVLDAVLGRS